MIHVIYLAPSFSKSMPNDYAWAGMGSHSVEDTVAINYYVHLGQLGIKAYTVSGWYIIWILANVTAGKLAAKILPEETAWRRASTESENWVGMHNDPISNKASAGNLYV